MARKCHNNLATFSFLLSEPIIFRLFGSSSKTAGPIKFKSKLIYFDEKFLDANLYWYYPFPREPVLQSASGSASFWEARSGSGSASSSKDPQPDQNEKQDPDPHLHHSEKVEVIEVILGALEIINLGKSEWWDPDLDPDPHHNWKVGPGSGFASQSKVGSRSGSTSKWRGSEALVGGTVFSKLVFLRRVRILLRELVWKNGIQLESNWLIMTLTYPSTWYFFMTSPTYYPAPLHQTSIISDLWNGLGNLAMGTSVHCPVPAFRILYNLASFIHMY
jgi:hypothetical protein